MSKPMSLTSSEVVRRAATIGRTCLCIALLAAGFASHAAPDLKEADARYFTLLIPKDMERIPVRGVDSHVGQYANKGIKLSFDYGWYSDALRYSHKPQFRVRHEAIHGAKARIVTFQRQPSGYVAAVHFPRVPGAHDGKMKLTIYSECETASDVRTALEIFKTVRFR